MRPILVTQIHDPKGMIFPHLIASIPQLKELFEAVYLSTRPATRDPQALYYQQLQSDPFFRLCDYPLDGVNVGEEFLALYDYAAASCPPAQILHLCFVDRLVYALQSVHKEQFCADMQCLQTDNTPIIYQRSAAAWETHPQNYHILETMVTTVGEMVFKKSLDFAWCHLALQAGELQRILPQIQARDISFVGEMVIYLQETLHSKDVDWLAWEDPFIENRDPQELKQERKSSLAEVNKRLAYTIPMMKMLQQVAQRNS